MRVKGWMGKWIFGPLVLLLFSSASAWGYYFDERQEMGLAGFFYTRGTIALQDGIGNQKHTFYAGNLVQHRNFGTLEWRHNIGRVTQDFPTVWEAFRFINLDAFDYYMNLRAEYDGVWDYGPKKIRRMKRGTRFHAPYFDDASTAVPFDGLYYTAFPRAPWPGPPGRLAADFPGDVISLTNRRYLTQLQEPGIRLFEWYFNVTKGPLFIRVGRQNLSWGETDAFRLLDQINPLDNSFGGFLTSLDERRIANNMLRAQWNFGRVGPIEDLALEGFWAIGSGTSSRYRFVNNPGLPTSSVHFWHGEQTNGNAAIMWGRTPCGGHFMAQRGIPPYSRDPQFPYAGSGFGPRGGGGCSQRGASPHASLDDGKGGVRIVGTIRDFTFSLPITTPIRTSWWFGRRSSHPRGTIYGGIWGLAQTPRVVPGQIIWCPVG